MRPVNLIPQNQRRRMPREGSGKGAYAVLGVLGLLLAMTVAYVLTSNALNERKTATEEARQDADRLEQQASALTSFSEFSAIKQARVVSVQTVAGTRFDWERLMRELSRVVPEGSWLQTTDASVTGADGEAAATTGAATPVGPSANLTGCTPRQTDVAKMMIRLRHVHRVTDVTLNQSAREQIGGDGGGAETTIDNCGDLYKFDLTLEFDPVRPANEAPRGAQRVPASLGGGS